MDEQDFDSLFAPRPFGTAEAMREDARMRREPSHATTNVMRISQRHGF